MGNRLIIARKEFSDLSGNRIMFVAIGLFLLFVLIQLASFYGYMHNGTFEKNINSWFDNPAQELAETLLGQLIAILTRYGAILAIAVGFLSVSDERHSGALNTLVVKPLHRNTIITGKMIGALGFLLCVFAVASAVMTSGLILICGDRITPITGDYMPRVPLAITAALLYSMIFFFSSMLISLVIKDYAFALILSLMTWSFSELLTLSSFAGNIAVILGDEKRISDLIISFSPDGMIKNITYQALTDFKMDLGTCIGRMTGSTMMLALCVLIVMLASYVVFNRRDIA